MSFNNPLWDLVPQHRFLTQQMYEGGIEKSSKSTYIQGFGEFVRTMIRLGIPVMLCFIFPICPELLQIYITDCAIVRPRKNCWNTIRNKLRSIDWAAQTQGIMQCWADLPELKAQVAYCKRLCKGLGSNTIPITVEKIREIINFIIQKHVINDLILTDFERKQIGQWLTFPRILNDPRRLNQYIFAMSIMFNFSLGLRGAEQYLNKKSDYVGYGIQIRDLNFIWKKRGKKEYFVSNRYTKATSTLHHL